MESTGVPGYTQVTQEVVDALQGSHFEFKCRGQINVKGKGDMITYFLNDTKPKSEIGMDMVQMRHPTSNYHENANYQGSVINKEIYMKKKNFGNFLLEDNKQQQPTTSNNLYGNNNGMNLTENLNYVKREYDNYNKININNHYNINYQPQHVQQHYNIRENINMNIIENPNEKQQQQHRNNYLGDEHLNNFRNENEPLLTNANVMPKVLYRAEHTSKYEPPQYVGMPFQRSLQPMTHDARYRPYKAPQQSSSSHFYPHQQQQQSSYGPHTHQQFLQQQQIQYQPPQYVKKQTNSAPYRYHHTTNNSNNNSLEVYMKPLPKLPPHNENESREMSSTDDLSQSEHRVSLSVDSSSDESYSRTDDFDQSNLKLDMPKTSAAAAAEYQKKMPGLKDLQDYEISSTTDHTVSTLPNKGESCNSFEFHNDKRELNCYKKYFLCGFFAIFYNLSN